MKATFVLLGVLVCSSLTRCAIAQTTNDSNVPLAVQNIRLAVAAEQAALAAAGGNNVQPMNDGHWPFHGGSPGPGGGTNTPGPPDPPPVFGTNLCLYLQPRFTNAETWLLLSNSAPGVPYEIIGSPAANVPLSNWLSFGLWLGALGTNVTPIQVALGTNSVFFFDAREWSFSFFTNHPSTNGQILLVVAPSHTNLEGQIEVSAMINGSSNGLVAVFSNYILLPAGITSLDLGYDASDSGTSNSTTYATWSEQQIEAVYGYSPTLTNLLLSYNPLTNLDVHGFPSLQDLECWWCTGVLHANVTNCPQLTRICLESNNIQSTLDLTGDTNLEQIRIASNYKCSNIVFGAAFPQLWHLCAHNNPLATNVNLTLFTNLSELWLWDAGQGGALILTNSPSLTSVQVANFGDAPGVPNNFTTADFHGSPLLWDIEIDRNPLLTNLNVTGCGFNTNRPNKITAENCALLVTVEDAALAYLDSTGVQDGTVDFSGANNTPLDVQGLTSKHSLTGKTWNAYSYEPPGTPVISAVACNPGSNTAQISWTTDILSDSTVFYGTTTNYSSSNHNSADLTNHLILLSGLTTNTSYHFYVVSTNNGLAGLSWDYEFTTTGPPNTNPIYFVSTSSNVNMQVTLQGSATATWYWGDGTNNTSSNHTFASSASYTNYVIISPANSLIVFGAACVPNEGTTLSSVWGLSNYPALEDIYFYQTGLTNLSLASCGNLVDNRPCRNKSFY